MTTRWPFVVAVLSSIFFASCAQKSAPTLSHPEIPRIPNQIDKPLIAVDNKALYCSKLIDSGMWDTYYKDPIRHVKQGMFRSCVDPKGDDPLVGSSIVYYNYQSPLTNENASYTKPSVGECKEVTDSCKSRGILTEVNCDPKTGGANDKKVICATLETPQTGKMVCYVDRCMPEKDIPTDLRVGQIFSPAHFSGCNNSFHFEICNEGPSAINRNFKITVNVNGVSRVLTYEVEGGLRPVIGAGVCVDFIDTGLLDIRAFVGQLNTAPDVTVTVNEPKILAEEVMNNNQKTKAVYTGAAWMYDEETPCDGTCYDSDVKSNGRGSDNPLQFGILSSVYQGQSSTLPDHCFNDQLREYFCSKATMIDGKLQNQMQNRVVNCNDVFANQTIPGICHDGNCVPADRFPSCNDTDGQDILTKGKVVFSTPLPGTFNQAPTPPAETLDSCKNQDFVIEHWCSSEGYHQVFERLCPEGSKCDDGKCVPTENLASCIDSDGPWTEAPRPTVSGGNPKVKGKVTAQTSTATALPVTEDYCAPGFDSVVQVTCSGKLPGPTEMFSCSSFGPGWGCHDGACIEGSDVKKSCHTDDNETAPDFAHAAILTQTDRFGNVTTAEEICADSKILVEWYCDAVTKDAKFMTYECPNGCSSGKCL